MTADRVLCIFTVCSDDSRSLATSIQLQPTAHLHLNELISNGLSVLNACIVFEFTGWMQILNLKRFSLVDIVFTPYQ